MKRGCQIVHGVDTGRRRAAHGVDSGRAAVSSFAELQRARCLRWLGVMLAYRDATASVEAGVITLEAAHRRALAAIPAGHHSLFVRRTARIAGAMWAAVVAVAMMVHAGGYAWLMLAGWAVVAVAYGGAAFAASGVLRGALRGVIALTGEPFRDRAGPCCERRGFRSSPAS